MNQKKESVDIHKENWLVSVFKHGKWYIVASLFSKGVGIFLMPVYTRFLTPADYGVMGNFESINRVLPIFISFYLDAAFGRFFHDYKKDEDQLARLFSSIFWFVSIWGAFFMAALISSSYFWINGYMEVPAFPYAYIGFIPVLFGQIGTLGIIFLRQSLKSKQTSILEVSTIIIGNSIGLVLLIGFDMGVLAKLIGGMISALFLYIYYIIYFTRHKILRFVFDRKMLTRSLIYSIPLIPNIAGGWIAGFSDRLIITKVDSVASTGLYSVGAKIAQILYLIQDSVTQVTGPITMSGLIYDKEKTKEKIARFSLILLAFMLLMHMGAFLFTQEALMILATKEYAGAYQVVAVLAFAYVLSSQYRIYAEIISYHKKTWVISSAGIIMAVSNLILNILLIPKYGYSVAAATTVFATLLYLSWIFVWAQIFEPVSLYWKRSLLVIFIYVLFGFSGYYYFCGEISWFNFFMKCLIFALSAGLFILVIVFKRGLKWLKLND